MPKAKPLTPAIIAEAALRIGDRDGAKAMSMRRIAGELGCDPMALYRHFPDRQALLDAVADLAMADVRDPDPGANWDHRLHALVTGIRAAALRHPGIAPHVAARPPLAEQGQRLGAAMMTALTQAGLSPADAIRTSQTLVAYAASALAMAVQGGTRDERWHQVSDTLSSLPDAPPGDGLPATGSDEQFEFGLRLLLLGIRHVAAADAGA
ncbi:AcrR family transcriptional regulator [Saccharothrix ecbatanensis]|uniref:AcrR family transcriptional regulator n=1 Tax=Saccharothrix ecbatanensis TaxID=1105145 RepID=A0A7W9LYV0_9PSEU|nr:TetR/AcrR family transcriptional regulator [Saccharothrix ecbatanensis]MBB5801027.1 AcrR family transcriptional regulator [Saccharothrix ecbatanensis]